MINPREAYLQFKGNDDTKDVLVITKSNERFRKNFCIAMDEGYMILSQLDLTGSEFKVLLLLISQMEFNNFCYIRQSFISEVTGIAQPNVSRHIRKMIDMGLIFKESTAKGKALRISSVISWKGKRDKKYNNQFAIDSEFLQIPESVKLLDFVQNQKT